MNRIAKALRATLLAAVALIVVWAFFDMGRRYVGRWQSLRERPIELTVMHWGEPAEDAIVDDLCARYEREHPTVRIIRINTNGSENLKSKLKTMMAADAPPDVFYLPPELVPEMAEMKLLLPLDERVAQEPQSWRDDFYPLLLSAFHYDPQTHQLGKGPLWALPKDFTTAVFYINIDLFERAGVDWKSVQRNGWTWDEFESATKKIRALNGTPAFAGRSIYGSLLQLWSDSFRNIVWTEGGDFFEKRPDGTTDFAKLALDEPGAIRAMERVARMRLKDGSAFNSTGIAKAGGQEFFNGNIGAIGPIGRWMTPRYKDVTSFKWDVVPIPRGITQASQTYYNGWTIAAGSKHPDESYDLVRFLCGREGQVQMARAGLAIPSLKSVAESEDFLSPPGLPKHNSKLFLDAIGYARIGDLPRQSEWRQLSEKTINRAIEAGSITPRQAAEELQAQWTAVAASPLLTREWPPMPWRAITVGTLVAIVSVVTLLVWRSRREQLGALDRATERAGFLFISPWLIGFLLLTVGPMLASLLLAFSRWTGLLPLREASFVGVANFRQLFFHDPTFLQSLRVTAYYVVLGVPLSQVAALAIAVLMNSRVRGITAFRTIYFVPSVVSGVALAVLWLQLFNNDYGLLNAILRPIAGLFGTRPPNWFGYDTLAAVPVNDAARWAVPAFVVMSLWGVGGGMIIYLAGLKGIPQSLYEAARIDGAGRWRLFASVTLPMLSPLIFYNLVMAIIASFQVFTQAYTMTGAGPENATLFYVLQLYYQAFEFHNMGYASAMAWVLFVIVLLLTLLVFKGSKNLVYYEGLRT